MLTIDGSQGEGGGQVLRTALGLSLVTGRAFTIEKIRAGRKRPGLLAQHLTAVRAAAEIGDAETHGAAVGSVQLHFAPRKVRPGDYRFAVGTAGSATLVLQTVLPALSIADGPSHLRLEGGTHNPWAPPFEFLDRTFLPLVGRMGPQVEAVLERPGFYPAGGGAFSVTIQPQQPLRRLELLERGEVLRQSVRAIVSRLPLHIARREAQAVQNALGLPDDCVAAEPVDSAGPGNAVVIEIECEHITEVFVGFGQKGVPAEAVARQVVKEAQRYLAADVPVGPYLADQLLIPLALAGDGRFLTLTPSPHAMTNLEVLRSFVEVGIDCRQLGEDRFELGARR